MDSTNATKRRSRDGCWTCRKRKKKCDATGTPCQNCRRLKLHCENEIRLVWEDDARRPAMRRRGPPVIQTRKDSVSETGQDGRSRRLDGEAPTTQTVFPTHTGPRTRATVEVLPSPICSSRGVLNMPQHHQSIMRYCVTQFPRPLNATESRFLEHYVLRFSRTYPTCSQSSNPFLTVLLPLAMRSNVVFDSVLALSGATRHRTGQNELERDTLRFRASALQGCGRLVDEIGHACEGDDGKFSQHGSSATRTQKAARDEKLLHLLASVVLFVLFEKVTGDTSWLPHMTFINELFDRYLQPILAENTFSGDVLETVSFLHQLFLYNDLVKSTSTYTAPLSGFYVAKHLNIGSGRSSSVMDVETQVTARYYFPNLISRISLSDPTVTEDEIDAWGGDMNWLPSFALETNSLRDSSSVDLDILSELYRTTAKVYRSRVFENRGIRTMPPHATETPMDMTQLASIAVGQITMMPEGSPYETALLWPIGIATKELVASQQTERDIVITCLQSMERRFQMRHFQRAQDFLRAHWQQKDAGSICQSQSNPSSPASLLLG